MKVEFVQTPSSIKTWHLKLNGVEYKIGEGAPAGAHVT